MPTRSHFDAETACLSEPSRCHEKEADPAGTVFAGIGLGDDRIPDETTILNFRHLPERHGLTQAIFAEVYAHLADQGITLRSGTLVDATLIDAPASTRNKAGARDGYVSAEREAAFKGRRSRGRARSGVFGATIDPPDRLLDA